MQCLEVWKISVCIYDCSLELTGKIFQTFCTLYNNMLGWCIYVTMLVWRYSFLFRSTVFNWLWLMSEISATQCMFKNTGKKLLLATKAPIKGEYSRHTYNFSPFSARWKPVNAQKSQAHNYCLCPNISFQINFKCFFMSPFGIRAWHVYRPLYRVGRLYLINGKAPHQICILL